MIYTTRAYDNAFDAGSIHYEGRWEGVGPWNWDFFEPCEMELLYFYYCMGFVLCSVNVWPSPLQNLFSAGIQYEHHRADRRVPFGA